MARTTAVFFILCTIGAGAASPTPTEDDCEKASSEGLQEIATLVGSRVMEPTAAPYQYSYQTRILQAAGANPWHDSPVMIAKKVQHLWHAQRAHFVANSLQFNVPNGSLLKFAVAKSFDDFVDDVTANWSLPLNELDKADGRTVLDYVLYEKERYEGSARERVMQNLYNKLRKAGAKHRTELKGDGADDPPDPYVAEIRPLLAAWDKACYFSEDLAAVKKDGKWGYVDRQHQIRIKPQYDGAFSFSEGRAAVVQSGKWGYIDAHGNVAVPLQYANARVFQSGAAEVTLDGTNWITIGLDGKKQ